MTSTHAAAGASRNMLPSILCARNEAPKLSIKRDNPLSNMCMTAPRLTLHWAIRLAQAADGMELGNVYGSSGPPFNRMSGYLC